VVALALFAYNGYDWPLYFGEETEEPRRVLPRAVMVAAVSAVVIEVVAVVVAMFDTGLSANLGYARIYFASGRDRMWPGLVSAVLASTNRNRVPKWASPSWASPAGCSAT
jgi:amino acid transporter